MFSSETFEDTLILEPPAGPASAPRLDPATMVAASFEAQAMLLHDLRAAVGILDCLLDPSFKPEEGADHLRHCRRVVDKVRRLTLQIQSATGYAKEPLQLRLPIDATTFLSQIAWNYQAKAARLGLWLEMRLADRLPRLQGDPIQLDRILSNLLENALQHAPQGGEVGLAAAPWTEKGESRPWIRIDVVDKGPGISPAQLAPLLSAQIRAEARPDGSGLGLSIVRRLVEAHGGRVQVLSRPGHGSQFTVLLPGARSLHG